MQITTLTTGYTNIRFVAGAGKSFCIIMKESWPNQRILVTLLMCTAAVIPSSSGWFYSKKDKARDDVKAELMTNRQFPECNCIQRLRTNYFSEDDCGTAALCYWETWNYKKVKAKIKGLTYEGGDEEKCDKYLIQSRACLIGYPKPQIQNEICDNATRICMKRLSKLLYKDCEEIRVKRDLPKPQDIRTTLTLDDMNLHMNESEAFKFLPQPSSDKPNTNHYYALSCPVIFRFPYFTISLLFKEWDPNIIYDETDALKGVAHILPKFLREGINNERIQNFEALDLDQNLINWCNIPRNYICILKENDEDGKTLCNKELCSLQTQCDINAPEDPSDCDFIVMPRKSV